MGQDMKTLRLEVGGSVFELIEFSLLRRIAGQDVRGVYGVNVAKVREVVRLPKINPLSSRVKGLAGVFELRGIPIPAVNLSVALGDDPQVPKASQQIIVTEFSQKRAGFIVDTTHRIRRIAWEKVLPPSTDAGTCINGMTLIENNEFLFILDLEKILINLEYGLQPGTPGTASAAQSQMAMNMGAGQQHQSLSMHPMALGNHTAAPSRLDGTGPLILLVDDSQFIRNGAKQALIRAGYRVLEAGDGVEAYEILLRTLKKSGPEAISMIVTDVEMPRMDGLTLTKKVRQHPEVGEIPIVLHTSLSGKANQDAGISVGANGYVVKNDFRTLLELVREIIGTTPSAISA